LVRLAATRLGKSVVNGASAGGLCGGLITPVSSYWAETNLKGYPYLGTTSTVVMPRVPRPPLLSKEAMQQPWRLPVRLLLFQWGSIDGTIAADTRHYPFGTRMYVPGYGWGVVEDRGGAIQGVSRVDLYHNNHSKALEWGAN
ncbi:hypothetical protein CYMTET_40907, partial [Cymbomonas tetramitiformis]